MPKLPQLSGDEIVAALEAAGFEHVRTKGSHAILKKEGHSKNVSVPLHDTVKRGTLGSIIRAAGMTPEEFEQLL